MRNFRFFSLLPLGLSLVVIFSMDKSDQTLSGTAVKNRSDGGTSEVITFRAKFKLRLQRGSCGAIPVADKNIFESTQFSRTPELFTINYTDKCDDSVGFLPGKTYLIKARKEPGSQEYNNIATSPLPEYASNQSRTFVKQMEVPDFSPEEKIFGTWFFDQYYESPLPVDSVEILIVQAQYDKCVSQGMCGFVSIPKVEQFKLVDSDPARAEKIVTVTYNCDCDWPDLVIALRYNLVLKRLPGERSYHSISTVPARFDSPRGVLVDELRPGIRIKNREVSNNHTGLNSNTSILRHSSGLLCYEIPQ